MLNSIGLTLSGMVFITFIAAIYFTKKKYKSLENSIYRFLLITTMVLLVLELVCVYTMSIRDKIPIINEFLCRLYILGDVVWFVVIIGYVKSLSVDKKYDNPLDFFQEKKMLMLIVFATIMFLISCFLEIKFTSGSDNQFYVIGGPAVYSLYVIFVFVGVYMLFVLLKDISRDNAVKRVPVILFLIFYSIMAIVQYLYADINDLSYLFAFCMTSMYFTLESQDIKLVSELEVAKREAEEADRAKTAFLSKMSHEIRTPMNTIMGFSESLLNTKDLQEASMKKDIESIDKAANTLLEIINNILDLSRIDSGKEKIDNVEYSIKDILFELNSFIYSRINTDDVKYVVDVDPNIPTKMFGDKVKIYRILSNILNNSAQHTKVGEIKLSIKSNVKDNKANLTFKISDTGLGIKSEDFNKIFNVFSSTIAMEENASGVGLGLVVVKDLVQMLSGDIKFESEYGIGTTFYITLTQEVVDKSKLGNVSITDEYSLTHKENFYFDCSNYKVLIVDDNKMNLKVASRLLSSYNLQIEEATSGEECISKIKDGNKYDLIFLDHLMPNLDGIGTIKILKKMGNKIPVVAMTANVVTEVEEKYLKEGFDDYISKPINIKTLNKLLQKYFKKDKGE